ncbi:MAG: molybdopterin-dependent oxidoreductase [Phycisphaerales bacterium]
MPSININGKECEFDAGQTILQVALDHGIEIPHYCYHEGLSIVASCRICLAEVWAPNPRNNGKLEAIPRLMPTCQTAAGDGQVVYTDSPKSIANQKAVMEYLLINHPLDCPICDQAGECYLQDYSYEYGRGVSRFEEEKIKQPKKDLGPNVYLYSDRCIMCSRCVRFTREVTETGELCVVGRGAKEQIDLFPGMALDNELASNVVDICPVGALLDKDFLFEQRVWLLTSTPSIDGVTASGDNIYIDHNEGRIYRVKPRKNMEVNKWWISDEIRYSWKFVHSDDRLTAPVRQQYGEAIETNFPTASEEIHDELTAVRKREGRLAVLVSPMLSCEEAFLAARYARHWDDDAILGVGPVPIDGEDKTFPPHAGADDPKAYTIRAEKAPNARGVRRVLGATGRTPLEFDEWVEAIKDADAVVITGNYPSEWSPKELTKALTKKFVVLVDTLPNDLAKKANVILPAATWTEKAGSFENASGLIQAFEQAIRPIEGTRSEGQIFTDLLTLADGGRFAEAPRYNAADTRARMADELDLPEFVTEVRMPGPREEIEADMEILEL